MKTRVFVAGIIMITGLVCWGCGNPAAPGISMKLGGTELIEDTVGMDSFVFRAAQNGLIADITGGIDEAAGKITVNALNWVNDFTALKAEFAADGIVTVDGAVQMSGETVNDFTADVVYTVTAGDGAVKNYTVSLETPQKLDFPILKIETGAAPITSITKETWIEGAAYTIYESTGGGAISGSLDIKGRGNSTWTFPKKPYALKLTEAKPLLGMPSHKRWQLLANYLDYTLLRNETSFKFGTVFDNLAWTPRSHQVSLYLNNEYLGVYQLTEAIKIDENRVNIEKISKRQRPYGGYLLEVDGYQAEDFHFGTQHFVAISCSDPDNDLDETFHSSTGLSGTIFEKIKNDVQHAEDVLYDDALFLDPTDGWQKYFDADSLVDWYIVTEIAKSNDSRFHGSVYFYYDPIKQKYCMGPLWDYDGGYGWYIWDTPDGFLKDRTWDRWLWIERFLQDPYFVSLVKARWNERKAEAFAVPYFIGERVRALEPAEYFDFAKWGVDLEQSLSIPTASPFLPSYPESTARHKTWVERRLSWLDTAINGL